MAKQNVIKVEVINVTLPTNTIRLTVLDVSGIYAQVFDDIYTDKADESKVREKYKSSKYMVVRTA